MLLRGRSSPRARVQLAAPDGWRSETQAGADGIWTARLPAAQQPRMYALSMSLDGRTVRAEGPVMTLPAPGPTALQVRAGYATLPLPTRAGQPKITAIDFDSVGSAAIGGVAAPNARVQLLADGQPADVDVSDGAGRFALMGPRTQPLASGEHLFTVVGPEGRDEARAALSPPGPLEGRAMRARREGGGWRVDWAAPGGGVQSTLVLDQAVSAS